ncbi:deoxyguanosinetriphosphate triphosphohydrolase [Carbonactinospora thermoautotrophica]|nr:deoxyguanosinetriphosphate triphosphohydrolase [Carbonactinospora thermoautotrophica]KWX00125.1 deoxyguanosinetriphosphate triphosphohydrolase [Carbonactinospora thermoautotrophica]KWX06613.1 deoxyguanosinetriphosphate triphosphohydrolase [Carbonactinospora thermoautotrophica]MCX9189850.1 deoxyguanosinetriphosphate triphosphohydrolase [Carbonactinospora thermoautotrophica]
MTAEPAPGLTGYDEADRERWVTEPPKRPGRSPFERDRARVLHSAALRRLAAKTQVVVPYESDFPRTRLTHSLECAQIGRELGKSLGCDPDLVETACLAHDLGHPPFGHTGEEALDEIAQPCGGFEGNAQSLRILTRLEAKTFSPEGRSVGLNLTRAALDAALKYPWPRPVAPGVPATRQKYGVYACDLDVFHWVRAHVPEGRRCLEAQVMDWADDVAYSVHDLEDAIFGGHVGTARLRDPAERVDLLALAAAWYAPDATPAELEEALDRLLSQPYWPGEFDGSLAAQAALKNATSQLIGRFCQAAEHATREAFGGGPLTRYAADLVVPRETRLECAVLKAVTARYVMTRAEAQARRARQREMIAELAAALLSGAPDTLEPVFKEAFKEAPDDAARLRVIVDQVASLTDTSAVQLHRRLTRR